MGDLGAGLGAVVVFLAAVVASWRLMGLGSLLKGTRLFLLDWFGEPPRPGVPARPSFPERMAEVEQQARRVDERTSQLNHEMRGELTSRLTMLAFTVDQLHVHTTGATDRLAQLDTRLTDLDARVSDHRRRNDEQVTLLREAVGRVEQRQLDVALALQPSTED